MEIGNKRARTGSKLRMASDAEILEAVFRSCRRAASVVHCSLKRKVTSLASIAATAVFLGILSTMFGIIFSFGGVDGEASAIRRAIAASLSDAVVPTALGLLVAIPAFCFYKFLCLRLEAMDTEMNNGASELVNCLALHLARTRHSS
jgi:biopolymer transport protein ExbB/TolQ